VSKHTIYGWKAKYGGMDVSQAQEAKQLRDENTQLRKLVADLSLDKEARTGSAILPMRGRRSRSGSRTTTKSVRTAACSTVPLWSSQRRLRASTEMKWGEQKPEKVSLSLD
jgi:hypothetical protein